VLVTAIDGTAMSVPDNDANMTGYTTHAGNHGGSGYPLMRVLVLPCGGTMIIDAVFGATSVGETTYTYHLLATLRAGMIVLLDHNCGSKALIAAIDQTGADVFVRRKNGRRMPEMDQITTPCQTGHDGRLLPVCGTVPPMASTIHRGTAHETSQRQPREPEPAVPAD
jgi:hypothetical protein